MPDVRGGERAALRASDGAGARELDVGSAAARADSAGQKKPAGRLRRRAVVGAVAIAGLAAGILVAMLGWSPGGHQPAVGEWVIQAVLLVAVVVIVASRVRRKG